MLLRLGVGNFRSLRDYSEVSLIASDAIKDKGPGMIPVPNSKAKALPFLLIYGANASGKSALYQALGLLKNHVSNSFATRKPGAPIPHSPFALDPDFVSAPTLVDCDFVVNDVRYHYGFEFDEREYKREWLYSYPEAYKRVLFYREKNEVDFGSTLRGRNKAIAEALQNRPNALFLSAAAQNGHPQLTSLYEWLSTKISGASAALDRDELNKLRGDQLDPRVVSFLRFADTGIMAANVRSETPPENVREMYKAVFEAINKHVPIDDVADPTDGPDDRTEITFAHAAKGGNTIDLPLDEESRGTRRLVGLLLKTFRTIDKGGVLFIDELDASLHTLLSMQLLKLFSDPDINKNGAQLLATTHDTNILCSDQVRRDQIWFTEKDADGATTIYPLTDIKTRNTDNLEKGYLQGRFGAVPFLGSIKELWMACPDA